LANKKITELTNLETPANADQFVLVDLDADETKSVTFANLNVALGDVTEVANVINLQANVLQIRANLNIVQDNVATLNTNMVANLASNDFITYSQLNANIDIVQDNVATLNTNMVANLDSNDYVTYVRLNANIDVVQDNVAGILDGATFTGEVTMNDDLIVDGNLAVHGDTITSNAINLVIQDPIVMLANGTVGTPTRDVGFLANRGNQGNAFFGYDESYQAFTLAETKDPVTNVTIHPTSLANLVISNLTTASLTIGSTLLTPTGTELNYVDGVTSAIQTQIDTKIATTDSASNDFVTYTRLNSNINIVSANVDTAPTQAEYTTSTINSYPIAVSTSSINKTQVYLDGIYQNKSQYVLANSSSNIQFKVAALVADLSLEIITDF